MQSAPTVSHEYRPRIVGELTHADGCTMKLIDRFHQNSAGPWLCKKPGGVVKGGEETSRWMIYSLQDQMLGAKPLVKTLTPQYFEFKATASAAV